MESRTPTVIYRTRSFSDAKSVAAYLRDQGLNARLAVENPQGYFGEIPVTDFVHEVMAIETDRDAIEMHLAEWEDLSRELKSASESPFCFHCGHMLAKSAVTCPRCSQSLDDGS